MCVFSHVQFWLFATPWTGAPSFFLELFLHSSPVAYRAPTNLGSSAFSVVSFCLFILFMGSHGKNTEVVCHFLLQWNSLVVQMIKKKKKSAYNAGDPGSIPGSKGSLEKKVATHSNILVWRIPWREEPGGLQSMGLQRVGPNSKLHSLTLHWITFHCNSPPWAIRLGWPYMT